MGLTDPRFQDAKKAREWLEMQRWPDGAHCSHCGSFSVTALKGKAHRPGVFQCNDCREQFTVTTGSVMEHSKIPLNKWLMAMHLMASSKKGYSAHQLHRTLGITYQSAWFLAHRIREAMANDTSGAFQATFERYLEKAYRSVRDEPGENIGAMETLTWVREILKDL